MTIEFYLAFIFTAFLVIASPGPTSFLVLAHAMGTNRRSPAFAIAGILCSNVVFVTVTVWADDRLDRRSRFSFLFVPSERCI